MIRGMIFIGVLLIVAAGGSALWWFANDGTEVQATRAARGAIREFVDERGKTRLAEPTLITMPFSARIEEIQFEEGQAVRAGEIVARVSRDDLAEELAEAQATVQRLEASLVESADISVEKTAKRQAELYVESMKATVAAAEAKLRADKSQLAYAETFLGRIQRLVPAGAETEDDLERARVAQVESEVAYRQDVLTLESQKSLQAATSLLPQMMSEYILRKGLSTEVLVQQRNEARARLRLAELRQARGTMVSPIDGVVLERAVRDEQLVPGGTLLLRIGRLESLEVETDVLSSDAGRIRPGCDVEIYGPAVGDGFANGVVQRVFPAGFTKISSLGVEQQRVVVIVQFREGALEPLLRERHLGVDYRVRVRIVTDHKEDALVVARSTLFRNGRGEWSVYVVRDQRARLKVVRVGLINDEHAEILDGLQAEDPVIVAPENGLFDGARVRPIFRESA